MPIRWISPASHHTTRRPTAWEPGRRCPTCAPADAKRRWTGSCAHSFPMRPTTELSRQLRQAGYPLGSANISEHEAIAGTQAAIWYLTNGLALDTRPLNVPVGIHRAPGPMITFEFDGQPQLGGYSVWTTSDTSVSLKLQKSANGVVWQDVSGSQLTAHTGKGRHQRTLGVGSTLSASSHGLGGRGYRYYRLIATADSGTPQVDHVRFWLTGYSPLPQRRSSRTPLHLPTHRSAQSPPRNRRTRTSRHPSHRRIRTSGPIPSTNPLEAQRHRRSHARRRRRIPHRRHDPAGNRLLPTPPTGHRSDNTDRNHPAQPHRTSADRNCARGGAAAAHTRCPSDTHRPGHRVRHQLGGRRGLGRHVGEGR